MSGDVQSLIDAADLNGLLRAVDRLCATRDWDGLVDLADRCEDAVERGKQLWPIADHIDHRLALEAPGDYAASVLESTSRFALGPLTEVAASTHEWSEVADHIESPQNAAFVAQERVLRGEVLDGDPRTHPEVLDLPLHLEAWEPTYALATYRSNLVEIAEPWTPRSPLLDVVVDTGGARELDEDEIEHALLDLVAPWTNESNGAARAVVVDGDEVAAISAIAFERLRIGALTGEEAMQRIAWAAASGGAHGRRRGAALGRSMAWYLVALLGDLGWPAPPEEVGRSLGELDWFYWDEGEPEEGWVLRLAVTDPAHGWSAAIAATDLREDEEEL